MNKNPPQLPAESNLPSLLQMVLTSLGLTAPGTVEKMLSTWSGWAVAITLGNYQAKQVPGLKKAGFELKSELMRLAVPLQPPGLGWDAAELAYRWKLNDLPGQPQLGMHSCSTRGSENLPTAAWEGKRWQNEPAIKELIAAWQETLPTSKAA